MSAATGVLAIAAGAGLRDEIDRVSAAAGLRVVHVAEPDALTRSGWLAATAVLLDERAAARCADGDLPRRDRLVLLAADTPMAGTWRAAVGLGAERVLCLPADADELVRLLAEAGDSAVHQADGRGRVVAVIGGRGGAGASVFAATLSHVAEEALLVDLDPLGGGVDLLIGTERATGLRWPDLTLRSGRLAWTALREALPAHPNRRLTVLSGTRRGSEPSGTATAAVLDAGRRGGVTVICDLPRSFPDAVEVALGAADLIVLVSSCDVRACASATAVVPRLRAVNPNIGIVVRGPSPGGLRAGEVARATGLPLLAAMRPEPRIIDALEHGGLRLPHRSALVSAARRVLVVLSRQSVPVGLGPR